MGREGILVLRIAQDLTAQQLLRCWQVLAGGLGGVSSITDAPYPMSPSGEIEPFHLTGLWEL